MRGEYPFHIRAGHVPQGTTSACAENTIRSVMLSCWNRNYLRVRGEYPTHERLLTALGELPPRARRIQWVEAQVLLHEGTTSACAENTAPCCARCAGDRNYLRVRGEYI